MSFFLEQDDAVVDFRAKEKRAHPEMDMTPMVDVTFLLLIFFMVTAAFTMQKSFEMPTPQSDQASTNVQQDTQDNEDMIVVRVDEFNTFHVLAPAWDDERECPSKQDLLVNLRDARSNGSATKMLVKAHAEATYEKVIMAMDAGTTVGMDGVKLMTVEDDY